MQQINRSIDLIRSRRFGDGLLLLELANATNATNAASASAGRATAKAPKDEAPQDSSAANRRVGPGKTVAEHLDTMQEPLAILLTSLEDYLLALGDDVQRKELKLYFAFKKLKNFAAVVLQRSRLLLYLHMDVDQVSPPSGIGRNVRDQGHWGTGDMEISLTSAVDLDVAKPFIQMAYESGGHRTRSNRYARGHALTTG